MILRYGWNSASYQIVNPGIERWFSADSGALVGYVRRGNYCIVAGAPVCEEARLEAVLTEFEAFCASRSLRTVYFCAGHRLEHCLRRFPKSHKLVLGAEPLWEPADFVMRMKTKRSLRAQVSRARHKSVTVEEWPVSRAKSHPELQSCLEQWLATRGLAPMHFLVESRTLERLLDRKVFVATRHGHVVAFSVLSPIPSRNGWLVEQNVRRPDAPNGSIECLLLAAAEQLHAEGAAFFSLGLSPLSRHADYSHNPRWLRLCFEILRHIATPFYNFKGLDRFKSKFEAARWDPVYAISISQDWDLSVLWGVASAFLHRRI